MRWKCNFSYKHYFEVLDYAKEEYAIGTIKEFEKLKKKNKFIILRHDVDYSLHRALKMAEEENVHGLKATYFIMLHNPLYNALSEDAVLIIKKISELGHDIGLHYDTTFLSTTKNEALRIMRKEASILEDICGRKVISVAQHNPTINPKFMRGVITNFVDAYSSKITYACKYISDSVQNWRQGCMCNHIDRVDKLQILTHPIWWSKHHKFRDQILNDIVNEEVNEINAFIDSYRKIYVEYLKRNSKI